MELGKDLASRQQVRELVEAARCAQEALADMEQAEIDRIVAAMAVAAERHSRELAELAVAETGFGNVPDKTEKNRFAGKVLWQAIEHEKTVGILRRDEEAKIWELAVPVGVIAGIVPSTNPTSTVIYKAMIAIKSGNAIVFSPHPGAWKCTARAAQIMMEAAAMAGCPQGAIGCIALSTMEAVDELMHHPGVQLILATGGSAMVRAAYRSGKPAIGVGAGNGPTYLHPSCDLQQAVSDIFRSKTFDNGVICASEQSIIVQKSNTKAAQQELLRQGGYLLSEEEARQLASLLFRSNGTMNPKIVGKTAGEIARLAKLSPQAEQARVLLAREQDAGCAYPYSMEKLCPVLALYEVEDDVAALSLSCKILRHEGSGHTFSIHAREQDVIERFARKIPVSRFLVNTPAALGGIGYTTALFPALTLGCGAVGGSASSNNIGPLDLINLRRVAWGHREEKAAHTTDTDDVLLDQLTEKLLQRLKTERE